MRAFGWMKHGRNPDVFIETHGFDAILYLRITRELCYCCAAFCVYGCTHDFVDFHLDSFSAGLILMPVNATGSRKNLPKNSTELIVVSRKEHSFLTFMTGYSNSLDSQSRSYCRRRSQPLLGNLVHFPHVLTDQLGSFDKFVLYNSCAMLLFVSHLRICMILRIDYAVLISVLCPSSGIAWSDHGPESNCQVLSIVISSSPDSRFLRVNPTFSEKRIKKTLEVRFDLGLCF